MHRHRLDVHIDPPRASAALEPENKQGFSITPASGPDTGSDVSIIPPPRTIKFKQVVQYQYITRAALTEDGDIYAWGGNGQGQIGDGTHTSRLAPVKVHTPAGVKFTKIFGGGYSAAALATDGTMYAWGDNSDGQLGTGDYAGQSEPVKVRTPSGVSFTQISFGTGIYGYQSYALALGNDGRIYAWGSNSSGQLGDGTQTSRLDPKPVNTPAGVTFTSVSAGTEHAMALSSDGSIYTWGSNYMNGINYPFEHGECGVPEGDGLPSWYCTSPVAAQTPEGVTFKQISAGTRLSTALSTTGEVYTWGAYDQYGQYGDGLVIGDPNSWMQEGDYVRHKATTPAGITFTFVSAGFNGVTALGTDGNAYSWGYNGDGQIADGTTTHRALPTKALAPAGVTFAQACNGSTALDADGNIYVWGSIAGSNSSNGTKATTPVQVESLQDASTIVVTGITFDGVPGSTPQLSQVDGAWHTNAPAHTPGTVNVKASWTKDGVAQPDLVLTYAYEYSKDFTVTFDLKGGKAPAGVTPCVGSTTTFCQSVHYGGTASNPGSPTKANAVFAGWDDANGHPYDFSTPVSKDITLQARWSGFSLTPSTGPDTGGTDVHITQPALSTTFAQVSAGGYCHSLALTNDGKIYGWGSDNMYGQIGNGSTDMQLTPVQAATPAGVTFKQVSAGYSHSAALAADGTIYTWGKNIYGQLGNGSTANALKPTAIAVPAGVTFTQVSAGTDHSMALAADGTVYTWGTNYAGQLGNGTLDDKLTPTAIAAPAGVTFSRVNAGKYQSFALSTTGDVYAWGSIGRLPGDGSSADRKEPVKLKPANNMTFTQLAPSSDSYVVAALGKDGKAYMWDPSGGNAGVPTAVDAPAGTTFTSIASGVGHTLVTCSNGKTYAWGYNDKGQLGDGNQTFDVINTPVEVQTPSGVTFTHVSAGERDSFAIGNDGSLYGWGGQDFEIGSDTVKNSTTPIKISALADKKDTTVTAVTFDGTPGKNTHFDTIFGNWVTTTPPHAEGAVDVRISWTLGGTTQPDMVLPFTYTPYHTVTFELKGGTAPAGISPCPTGDSGTFCQGLNQGDQARNPGEPTKSNFIFDGWFNDADGTGAQYDFTKPVTGDITITAHWKQFSLSATSGTTAGGTTVNITAPTLSSGAAITVKSVTFDAVAGTGLAQDPTSGVWSVTAPAHAEGNVTGTIAWSLEDGVEHTSTFAFTYVAPPATVHTVTFNPDADAPPAGTTPCSPGSSTFCQSVTDGSTATDPGEPAKSNWVFTGWFTAAQGGHLYDFSSPVTSDITLTAHWEQFTAIPSSGSESGGTAVYVSAPSGGLLHGADLQVLSVAFDGTPGTAPVLDAASGTWRTDTPAHAAGAIDATVTWTLNGGATRTNTFQFTYKAATAPTPPSDAASALPMAGGTGGTLAAACATITAAMLICVAVALRSRQRRARHTAR